MPTYYEILKVAPEAPVMEVEAACDALYNQWRRLVTHHDPKVVDEANKTLRQVEQIRYTLVDPAKRAGYNAGIGVGGAVGGLADPEAVLRQAAVAPPSPRPVPPAPRGGRPCLQCGAMNGPKERYCGTCGASLVRTCPECSSAYYVGQAVCGRCGYSYEVAEQRSAIQSEISQLQSQMEGLEAV